MRYRSGTVGRKTTKIAIRREISRVPNSLKASAWKSSSPPEYIPSKSLCGSSPRSTRSAACAKGTLIGRNPPAVQERQHIRERRTPEQIRKNNQPSVCRWSVLCHSLDGLLQRFCQGSGFADSQATDSWEHAATGGWTRTRAPRKPFQSDTLNLKCLRSPTVGDAGYRPFITWGELR